MINLDANVLIYAYNESAPQHTIARHWLEKQFDEPDLLGFSWQVITAFLRLSTNARAFPMPLPVAEACEVVDQWLDHPKTVLLLPTERHWPLLRALAVGGQAIGPLLMDAHLAALSIEHGAALATTDRDFSRFAGLRIIDPLAS
jgi:toxin-antitoxin system PIN domain toxin